METEENKDKDGETNDQAEQEAKDEVAEELSKNLSKNLSKIASQIGSITAGSAENSKKHSLQSQHVIYTTKQLDVAKNMEEIHTTFKSVVDEFSGDKAADKLMAEYEKLYDYAKKSHNEVHTWKLRCHALTEEVKINTDKLNLAIHLSQEDRALIASLHRQACDAWSMVDELHERERKAKNTVSRMQDEVHLLTCMVENGMGLDELLKLSSKAGEELKSYEEQNKNLKDELTMFEDRYSELIAKNNAKAKYFEDIINNLKIQNDTLIAKGEEDKEMRDEFQQHIFRLERTKARLTGEYQRTETEIAANKNFIKRQGNTIAELKRDSEHLNNSLLHERKELQRSHKEQEDLKNKFEMLTKKYAEAQEMLDAEKSQNTLMKNLLEARNREIQLQEHEIKKKTKRIETQSNELRLANENLNVAGQNLKCAENEMKSLENNMNSTLKELDNTSKSLKTTIGNYETSQKALRRVRKQKQNVEDELLMSQEGTNRLYNELLAAYKNVRQVLDNLKGCSKAKENLIMSLNVKATEIAKLESDVAASGLLNQLLEKTNSQLNAQVKEEIRNKTNAINERDSVQANLNRSEMENKLLRAANANVLKQTKSLQIEVENKDYQLTKLTDKFNNLRSQYDKLCMDLIHAEMDKDKLKSLLFQTELQLKNANNLIDHQNNTISDNNIRIKQLTSHRNILGATCVKNNTKIDMLITKHDLLEEIMNNGNKLYEERVKEIKLLHLQNTDLYRQKDNIMKKLENIDSLKSKLSLANKDLINAKAHLRALEDQPAQNVHDFRTIKSKDHSKYQLIMKANHLVKRLIIKSEEVTKLESALVDKAYIVDNLRKMLNRAPDTAIVVKAVDDRKKKEKAENKLKAALAEINMLNWNAKEKQKETKKMQEDLVEEKKKRMMVIKGCQSTVKKCEKKITEASRFLPPIINRGF